MLSIPTLDLSDLMIALNGHYARGNCQNKCFSSYIFYLLESRFRDICYTIDQNQGRRIHQNVGGVHTE